MNATSILAFFIGVLYPLYFILTYRATNARIKSNKKYRLRDYKLTMTVFWSLTIIILLNSIYSESFSLEFFPPLDYTSIIFAFLIVLFIAIQVRQTRVTRENASLVKEKMRNIAHYLPQSKGELTWFIFLSISAGICEEIIFRMFLFTYLQEHFQIILSFILANFVFAITHIGSGQRNMISSFFLGLVFTGIYYVTNNIWLPIILHTAIDINTGIAAYKVNKYVTQERG